MASRKPGQHNAMLMLCTAKPSEMEDNNSIKHRKNWQSTGQSGKGNVSVADHSKILQSPEHSIKDNSSVTGHGESCQDAETCDVAQSSVADPSSGQQRVIGKLKLLCRMLENSGKADKG